ncbi:MAG: family 10 glycosylhydrolase [Verrucomicrobiales bacterium]|nr:family 10 glycosylhydrolase [Verrucomicrobiales bacterium]
MRASWIATVRNIDWPSDPDLPPAAQQDELLLLIERASELRLNALILQVRPAGDALYASQLEPWSPFLTSTMGQAPDPAWDPLQFAIDECHLRGIELHAWFNPFRALAGEKFPASPDHITRTHPEWTMKYNIDTWMDPGIPEIRQRTIDVLVDVTRRYDVDGIHIDDYFYPYPVAGSDGKNRPFPDDKSYAAYQAAGGRLDRSHWRRENVDTTVRDIYTGIKQTKRWVKFGVSPFGLWRPGVPEGTGGGLDPYEDLAADSRKWLQQGWLDYFVPQLYWPIEPPKLSFTTYYDWWLTQNPLHRYVWPGMAVDRVGKDRGPAEILRQISAVRQRGASMTPGHVHWNFGTLAKDAYEVGTLTRERAYQVLAIPPATPWLSQLDLPAPVITPYRDADQPRLKWAHSEAAWQPHTRWWVLQGFADGQWTTLQVLPGPITDLAWPSGQAAIAIRAAGPGWELSPPTVQKASADGE